MDYRDPADEWPGATEEDLRPRHGGGVSPHASSMPPDPDDDPWRRFYETAAPRRGIRPRIAVGAVAVVMVVAAAAVSVWWMGRSSTTATPAPQAPLAAPAPSAHATDPSSERDTETAAASSRLLRQLPAGYPDAACTTAAPAGAGVLATVRCGQNADPGGPQTATYTLIRDNRALNTAFRDVVGGLSVVTCPGNIQSPGPWRRRAAPERISGTLVCGTGPAGPTVAWTDDTRLLLSVVHGAGQGPVLDQLYSWWSSHS